MMHEDAEIQDAEHPLDAVARAHDDPDLFPHEVRALYDAGRARRARKMLLRIAGKERDETRSALQLEVADDARLWLDPLSSPPKMYTFNGFGTILYGKSRPASDGTYIATLWFALLFVPVWPLGSYLVVPAQGGGWFFVAKAPFSPLALGVRRFVLIAAVAIAVRMTWGTYWSDTHAELLVYNAFDRPVTVTVAENRDEVPPGGHIVLDNLRLEPTAITARWPGEDEPFESLSFDLTEHGDGKAIYNIANRGVLRVDYIVYGDRVPSEGWWLGAGPVSVPSKQIDYLLVEPPESKRLSEGSTLENSMLHDLTADRSAVEAVGLLIEDDRNDHALQVARAELMAHPTDARLAAVTAHGLLANDFAAQLELFRELIDRSPNTVDLHRYYQSLWPDVRQDEVKAEYAALLAEYPSNPMYHYLVGRLEDGAKATAHYEDARALDPDYPPVYRALGYQAVEEGAWVAALRHYERYTALDPVGGEDVLDARVRISLRVGKSTPEIAALLPNEPPIGNASYVHRNLLTHLRVASDPSSHIEASESLLRFVETQMGLNPEASLRLNVQADVAITAGALDEARELLSQIGDPTDRHSTVALRLALSAGATSEDERLLTAIPDWYAQLDPAGKFLALTMLEPEVMANFLGEFEGSARDVVDMLQSANQLRNTERMIEATQSMGMNLRVAAYFAASRALQSVPGSVTARRFYREEAYAMALPGELPLR